MKLTSLPENVAEAEVNLAARELCAAEVDRAAGEPSSVEVAAVEDHAGEVEVQPLPRCRNVFLQMRGDNTDHSVTDFAACLEGKPFRGEDVLSGIRLIRHPQVRAQYIDAGLPVFLLVVGQARHGVHPSQSHGRRLIVAQLLRSRGEPLVQRPGPLLRKRPVKLLVLRIECSVQVHALLREGAVQLAALRPNGAVQLLALRLQPLVQLPALLGERSFGVLLGSAAPKVLRNHGARQGQHANPGRDPRGDDRRGHGSRRRRPGPGALETSLQLSSGQPGWQPADSWVQ